MLKIEEARDRILEHANILGIERLPLIDSLGRICAENVVSNRRQPPWDNSSMDGFAVRSEDILNASEEHSVTLTVIEDIMAGMIPKKSIGKNESARIMTGAPMPNGADAIIRVEWVTSETRDQITVSKPLAKGFDVRKAGEDQEIGDILVFEGKKIRPSEIALIASAPRSSLNTYRQPIVSIIATGDELAEPDMPIKDGQIVNTNSYGVAAMVKACGAIPRILPIALDNKESLRSIFLSAKSSDIIISSGGVSVGEHDFVKEVLEELGVTMNFWRVEMAPGKPLAFGLWDKKLVFGLPGNPVSSLVSFELFVRPAILKVMGFKDIYRKTLKAVLKDKLQKRSGVPHFLRVKLSYNGSELQAHSTGNQGSGVLRSMSLADGLLIGEPQYSVLEPELIVDVLPLDY